MYRYLYEEAKAMKLKSLSFVVFGAMLGLLALRPAQGAGNRVSMLYVGNVGGDDVSVINLNTMKVAGDIKVGYKPHGLAASPDGRLLFVTVESDNTLKEIDTATGKIVRTMKLSATPNEPAITPNGKFLAIPIRTGGAIDIVNVPEFKIVKVVPLDFPHNCVNSGSNEDFYCESRGLGTVDRIDLRTLSDVDTVPVDGDPRPFEVTRDEKTMFIQVTDMHGFNVVDVPTRKIVRWVHLPPTSERNLVEPMTPSHGMAISPDGKELWVADSMDHTVYVYDIATHKLTRKIVVGKTPLWIAFSADGKYCCVSTPGSNQVSIINAKTYREVARLNVGKLPKRLATAAVPAAMGN